MIVCNTRITSASVLGPLMQMCQVRNHTMLYACDGVFISCNGRLRLINRSRPSFPFAALVAASSATPYSASNFFCRVRWFPYRTEYDPGWVYNATVSLRMQDFSIISICFGNLMQIGQYERRRWAITNPLRSLADRTILCQNHSLGRVTLLVCWNGYN